MSYLKKLGYVKGLAEGLSLREDTPEGKVLLAMLDLLEDMAETLHDMEDISRRNGEEVESLSDEVADLDDRLEELEEDISEMADGLEEFFETVLDDHDHHHDHDDEDEDDDAEILYEVKCPACSQEIVLDEEMLERGSVKCEGCGELLEFDIDGCDDPDCDHCHHHEEE